MEISETLLKEAATMSIALTSRHQPPLIHGFQMFYRRITRENLKKGADQIEKNVKPYQDMINQE